MINEIKTRLTFTISINQSAVINEKRQVVCPPNFANHLIDTQRQAAQSYAPDAATERCR